MIFRYFLRTIDGLLRYGALKKFILFLKTQAGNFLNVFLSAIESYHDRRIWVFSSEPILITKKLPSYVQAQKCYQKRWDNVLNFRGVNASNTPDRSTQRYNRSPFLNVQWVLSDVCDLLTVRKAQIAFTVLRRKNPCKSFRIIR